MPTFASHTSGSGSSSSGDDQASDSGEEVQVDEHLEDQESHTSEISHLKFVWHVADVQKLGNSIFSQISSDDVMAPYSGVKIDWSRVSKDVGIEESKCIGKWNSLLSSVRTYRTLPEIIGDILAFSSKPQIGKHNKETHDAEEKKSQTPGKVRKKKKAVNPDHPKKPPVNGYSAFCQERIKSLREKGSNLMLKLGELWRALSESEREAYNTKYRKLKDDYLKAVQKYAAKHPDDEEIQRILHEEERAQQKRSGGKKSSEKSPKKEKSEKTTKAATHESESEEESTQNDTMMSTESDSILHSPKKSGKLSGKVQGSPKKRHLEEQDEVPTPSKKKKRKTKVLSGEDTYIQTKFESYRMEHPDLDDQEIRQKLKRRYEKMSDSKKEKYTRQADEQNS